MADRYTNPQEQILWLRHRPQRSQCRLRLPHPRPLRGTLLATLQMRSNALHLAAAQSTIKIFGEPGLPVVAAFHRASSPAGSLKLGWCTPDGIGLASVS